MKSPREVAHELANEWDASCCLGDELGWSHGVRCESITAAITTRDAEHQETPSVFAAQLAALRDRLAATEQVAREGVESLSRMLTSAEARAVTARREAFNEALGVISDCVSASASNPTWDACRSAIAEDIRAARDRGTP